MLGLTRKELERSLRRDRGVRGARDFIDAPVKTYSSGMYMRLGFAVAIHVDPDVLLIDEVLAVGDEAFTRKCLDKIAEFRRRGKTILFVTHSLGLVEKMCDDVLWLSHGKTRGRGEPKRVVDEYLTYVAGGEEALLALAPRASDGRCRRGRRARLGGAASAGVLPARAAGAAARSRSGRAPAGRARARAPRVRPRRDADARASSEGAEPVEDFVFGIGLFAADGTCVYGTNTDLEGFVPRRLGARPRCASRSRA